MNKPTKAKKPTNAKPHAADYPEVCKCPACVRLRADGYPRLARPQRSEDAATPLSASFITVTLNDARGNAVLNIVPTADGASVELAATETGQFGFVVNSQAELEVLTQAIASVRDWDRELKGGL